MGFHVIGLKPTSTTQYVTHEGLGADFLVGTGGPPPATISSSTYVLTQGGDLFRSTAWEWHPLWMTVCLLLEKIGSEFQLHGDLNDELVVDRELALSIADKLEAFMDGRLSLSPSELVAMAGPAPGMAIAEELGFRMTWQVWFDSIRNVVAKNRVVHQADLIAERELKKQFPGKVVRPTWDAIRIDEQLFRYFITFCRESGGFKIC